VASEPPSKLSALRLATTRAHPSRFNEEAWMHFRNENIKELQPYYPLSAPCPEFPVPPSHALSVAAGPLPVYR